MELTFEKFNYKNNLSQQRELFKASFPETDGNTIQSKEHYMWKFHSFPNDIQSYEYASYIDSEMVGYYAALPYRYKIGSINTNLGMVCDVMTSPKHRGQGIFAKMGRFSTQDLAKYVPFTIGYPIRNEVIPGHLKVGWKIAFPLPLYIKFFSTDSLLKARKLRILSPVFNFFLKVYNSMIKTKNSRRYISSVLDRIENVNGYEEFEAKWRSTNENCLIKDFEFVKWRYNAPERFYTYITISYMGNIIGFVSYRKIIKDFIPSYGIVDYMVLPGYEDCHGLINSILKVEAEKDKVECLLCMMSRHSAKKYLLLRNGFLKSPFCFQLIIKNLSDSFKEAELFNESNWHLMWVDSDDL